MFSRGFWVSALIALCPFPAFGQGRIEQIRQDANRSDNSPSSKSKTSDLSDPDFDESWNDFLLTGLAMPFLLPHKWLDDDYTRLGYFPAYPYSDNYPAYLWQGRWPERLKDIEPEGGLPNTRWWSVRMLVEDGNDFRGMNRLGLRATVDTASRFGFQSNWNLLSENLSAGSHDETVLGDTSLTYRFAQHEQVQMYTGLGFRVLTDPSTTNLGFNFLYALDYFPAEPFVFSTQFDAGTLGSAAVLHGRTTLGIVKNHFELFGGHDFLRIGSVNIQGPMVGLRLWF